VQERRVVGRDVSLEHRCSSIGGEYLLAGNSPPSAPAIARTWCGPAPQQMACDEDRYRILSVT